MVNILISGILRGGMYVLIALGLALVYGVMRIPNFAHGEYYLIGAYAAYFALVSFGWPPAVAILFAAVVGFVFGAVIEKLTFAPLRKRNTGDWVTNAFMIGAGIQLIIQNGAQYIFSANYFGVEKLWDGNVAGRIQHLLRQTHCIWDRYGNAGCLLAVPKKDENWHFHLGSGGRRNGSHADGRRY